MSSDSNYLSPGPIAGICIGAFIAVLLLVISLMVFYNRVLIQRPSAGGTTPSGPDPILKPELDAEGNARVLCEADGKPDRLAEIEGRETHLFEMPAPGEVAAEMEAGEAVELHGESATEKRIDRKRFSWETPV